MRIFRPAAALFVLLATALGASGAAAHPPAAQPACTCAEATRVDGWCDAHRVGFVASIRIPSQLLFDALDAHGHELDLSTFTCPTCKRAIKTGGFCELDSIGFVQGQAYFSRLTYEIARGERTDLTAISCPTCRKNFARMGWCKRHKIGRVGNVAIRDPAAYERAAHAAAIVEDAVAALPRCEWCGIAMVTNTKCPICGITYRDGKRVP